jgi:hypothetical protein
MKKKLISIIVATTIVASLLTGCESSSQEKDPNDLTTYSKEDLIASINSYTNYINVLESNYSELNTMYQALTTEEQPTAAVSMTGDGTNRLTFNSVDSKIIFPTSFQYPNSTTIQSNGSINIVDNVQISTTSNWITKLNGTTLELEHSSGISGTIKITGISEQYDVSALKDEVLSQWFTSLPESSVIYKNIYFDGVQCGVQATTSTMIDSENAYLRCGMAATGDYAVTYIFVYRGTQDSTKDECVTNLLNTIKTYGAEFQVQD